MIGAVVAVSATAAAYSASRNTAATGERCVLRQHLRRAVCPPSASEESSVSSVLIGRLQRLRREHRARPHAYFGDAGREAGIAGQARYERAYRAVVVQP